MTEKYMLSILKKEKKKKEKKGFLISLLQPSMSNKALIWQ